MNETLDLEEVRYWFAAKYTHGGSSVLNTKTNKVQNLTIIRKMVDGVLGIQTKPMSYGGPLLLSLFCDERDVWKYLGYWFAAQYPQIEAADLLSSFSSKRLGMILP